MIHIKTLFCTINRNQMHIVLVDVIIITLTAQSARVGGTWWIIIIIVVIIALIGVFIHVCIATVTMIVIVIVVSSTTTATIVTTIVGVSNILETFTPGMTGMIRKRTRIRRF